MKANDPELSYEKIRSLFDYDKETGKLLWKVCPGNGSKIGGDAGSLDKATGYVRVKILGKQVMAQRIIWFWMTGSWPSERVDHRDTIRSNNRWENLREASNSQNTANTKLRSDNTSGLKGVTFHKPSGKWHTRIMTSKNKSKSLGLYDCRASAYFAYVVAADKVFGEFARAA